MELSKSNYISITQRDDRLRDLSFKKLLKRLKGLSNHDYFFLKDIQFLNLFVIFTIFYSFNISFKKGAILLHSMISHKREQSYPL